LQGFRDNRPGDLGLGGGLTVDIPGTDELDILRRDNEGLEADNAGLGEEIDKLEKKLDALARRDFD
jgi:cell division protein FtsB